MRSWQVAWCSIPLFRFDGPFLQSRDGRRQFLGDKFCHLRHRNAKKDDGLTPESIQYHALMAKYLDDKEVGELWRRYKPLAGQDSIADLAVALIRKLV
jgi:hypothetical protein